MRQKSKIWALMLVTVFALLTGACASAQKRAEAVAPASESWLRRGQELAQQGQSLRAEQYYLAALEEGAPATEVLPLLVETCVQAGRFRSALTHVQRARRLSPGNVRLLQLSATLHLALGQEKAALTDIAQLEAAATLPGETWLFLGEFYEQAGSRDEAIHCYEKFLAQLPAAEESAWVKRQLQQLRQQSLNALSETELERTFVKGPSLAFADKEQNHE